MELLHRSGISAFGIPRRPKNTRCLLPGRTQIGWRLKKGDEIVQPQSARGSAPAVKTKSVLGHSVAMEQKIGLRILKVCIIRISQGSQLSIGNVFWQCEKIASQEVDMLVRKWPNPLDILFSDFVSLCTQVI